MSINSRSHQLVVALALAAASCSQGDARKPATPTAVGPTRAPEGVVGASSFAAYPANDVGLSVNSLGLTSLSSEVGTSAAGDVKNGPIEILRVRIRPESAPYPYFFAEPGGVYRVDPSVPIEFWVEWESSRALAEPPRLAIDWDFSESDNIHCGPCRLTKSIPEGLHQVTIRMDDRVGGVTRRTFTLNSAFIETAPACTALTTGTFVSASLNVAGPLELGRLFRDGTPSTCPTKAYPGLFNAATSYAYRTFSYTNQSASATCLTVNFDPNTGGTPCGTNAHASAYLGSYDPANQATGFLGDVGSSVTQPFSFTVPGSAKFVIVVTNTSGAATCDFRFSFNTTVCQ